MVFEDVGDVTQLDRPTIDRLHAVVARNNRHLGEVSGDLDRQDVLERVAERALECVVVLVVAALGDDVAALAVLVARARAEGVGVPLELA